MRTASVAENGDDTSSGNDLEKIARFNATRQQEQIDELQKELDGERDARKEERFFFIVIFVILFDIVFFSMMPSLGGPIALLVLQLLILIPLAKRMGMEEIAQMMSRVVGRIADKAGSDE